MSRTDAPALRAATGEFCRSLLEAILPAVRLTARHHGYAVAVHGSLSRDIDLIAVAWREHNVSDPDELVRAICGAIAGVTGSCLRQADSTKKPHGRVAFTLIHGGFIGEIDLSVIPPTRGPGVID
ncbi:hypothetical protein [Bradyrhizobium sp. WSM4349]|uniref:hypothetical protein n=1 Tax=Bradyrhizobium sp. WSM4349 TaxID=1040988 RepID=UPI0003705966|nr:hypothetical protein [Bradyrhizobium sp. WSM4349]